MNQVNDVSLLNTSPILLILLVSPKISPFQFEHSPMNAGDFANIQCVVPSGDLPLNITWRYPGGQIGISTTQLAERVNVLMIPVLTERHVGNYTCYAMNKAGVTSYTTALTVNGLSFSSSSSSWFFILFHLMI